MANWADSAEPIQCFCNCITLQGSRQDGSLEELCTMCVSCTANFCDFKGQLCGPEKIKTEACEVTDHMWEPRICSCTGRAFEVKALESNLVLVHRS